ncbi:MAG: alkaline phosphatase family protein [Anaerolineae bacterium]|nr:alkaline phosphatase family protein [Anaerolineae bacterium]
MRHRYYFTFVLVILLILLPACVLSPRWSATLLIGGDEVIFDTAAWRQLVGDFGEEVDGQRAVPLERVLWEQGAPAVEAVSLDGVDYAWDKYYDRAWWLADGRVLIGEETVRPERVTVIAPELLAQATASITDIAPTVASALGLPAPQEATGRVLTDVRAEHVVLLFLDAYGYIRHQEALAEGLNPRIAALGEPLCAVTTYPTQTPVSTASLLTGAPPLVHGVRTRGIRQTDAETLFDKLTAAGRRGVAVEGGQLAFNLRNAEIVLSGDKDGNGGTDDNTYANTLAVLEAGVPDLLLVHFHGIDDVGHEYGPLTPPEEAKISEVDGYVGDIVDRLPPGTLVILFADHGMHTVQEGERLGNHGSLLARDVFIPILLYEVLASKR